MSDSPITEHAEQVYWQINNRIPTIHHWPESNRVPVDDSLPRHALDIRRGVQWQIGRRLDDLLERCILCPLGKFLLWIYDRSSR